MERMYEYENVNVEPLQHGYIHDYCEEAMPMSPVGWSQTGEIKTLPDDTLCLRCGINPPLPLYCIKCAGGGGECNCTGQ